MAIKIEYERIRHPKYKYRLTREYTVQLGYATVPATILYYVHLWKGGSLAISKGYCWDGASGPTIDTENFMRGSLVHDVLYQLIRENLLERGYRKFADRILYRILREDGMWRIRAAWVWAGVRPFGRRAAR